MGCDCNNTTSNVCRQDIPYPQVSHESVPSLIDNLVQSLYGNITKYVDNGRVRWNIPCDPSDYPTQSVTYPRLDGEGTLCYVLRLLSETVGQFSPFQTWSYVGNGSIKTFALSPSNNTLASSYLVYINGIVQPPAAYNISNTSPVNLVFEVAPANGSAITIVNLGYTPPFVIDATQAEATPTGSTNTQTIGAWLAQLLIAVQTPAAGVPEGGARWSLIGNGATASLALTGAKSGNPTAYLVYIDGVVQDPADYNIVNLPPYTLQLSEAVPIGAELVVISINSPIAGWFVGEGNPNGVVIAPVGSLYVNSLGGQGTTLWVKEVGSGNTGWVAQSSGSSGPPVPAGGTRWSYIGNGTQAIFALPGATATTPVSYIVGIDGVLQDPIDYTIDTTTNPFNFNLSEPLPSGSKIVIVG